MKIIAIDFSITSPAVTIIEPDDSINIIAFDNKNCGVKTKLPQGYNMKLLSSVEHKNDLIRFDGLTSKIIEAIGPDNIKDSIIAFEGYSFESSGQLTRIAEACCLMKYKLYSNGCDPEIMSVAPGTIKKFATGSGLAKKPEMVEAFKNSTGINLFEILNKNPNKKTIDAPITDIADSYWIAKYVYSKRNPTI